MWALIVGLGFFSFSFWKLKKIIALRWYQKKHYTERTTLRVIEVKQFESKWWDEMQRGAINRTCYMPVYEYTVEGRSYKYYTRQGTYDNIYKIGDERVGYYNPEDPTEVSEYRTISEEAILLPYIVMMAVGVLFSYLGLESLCWYYF